MKERPTHPLWMLQSIALGWLGMAWSAAGFAAPQAQPTPRGVVEPAMVANGSFEKSTADGMPAGWSCATDRAAHESLVVNTAHAGARAIQITAQGDAVRWASEPIDVQPGRTYRLGFHVHADGQGHWSYALQTLEVAVVLSREEQPGETVLANEIRVLRTEGWSQAWLHVPVPDGCRRLRVAFRSSWPAVGTPTGAAARLARFWYGTGPGKPGRLLVDDVTLEPVDEAACLPALQRTVTGQDTARGLLCIRTADGQTGTDVPARLLVMGQDGCSLAPADAYCYGVPRRDRPPSGTDPPPAADRWPIPCDDQSGFVSGEGTSAQLLVPPGTYRVRAVRGLTIQPVEQEVLVKPGAVARVVLTCGKPAPGWLAEGWLAGDHHVHLFFHGRTRYPLMTIPTACRIARAEGLDYLSFQAELAWLKRHVDKNPDFTSGEFICEVGHEITTDFWGHVNYVNAVSVPDLPMPPALWPANHEIRNMVDRNGSMLVYTHPFGGMTEATALSKLADPAVGLLARGFPVDVLLGQQVMVDILSGSTFDMGYKMQILERLWNLGFRFGVGGSSDAYVDQGVHLPGSFRTFVLPSAKDFAAIGRAYREGRTFATNGPLLRLTVDNRPVGTNLVLDAPRSVQVDVHAHSWWGLSSIEIVHDGAVVAKVPAEQKAGSIQAQSDLQIRASGWLYARVWGPPAPELRNVRDRDRSGQFAMTSPVWLTVRGRPQRIRRDDIEFFDSWLNAVADAVPGYRQRLLASGPSGTDDELQSDAEHALRMLASARQALHVIAQRAKPAAADVRKTGKTR